jgi:hypothetical protein
MALEEAARKKEIAFYEWVSSFKTNLQTSAVAAAAHFNRRFRSYPATT